MTRGKDDLFTKGQVFALHKEGKSYAVIGDQLGLHKATIQLIVISLKCN